MDTNTAIAEHLSMIGSYYDMAKDTYRAKTFNQAANAISEHRESITSGAQARRNIKGVGESVQTVIDEFLSTGTSTRLLELEAKFADRKSTIDLFRSIYGIGPVAAVKFYNQGFRTLEDLWTRGNLNDAQKEGIIWREHIALRIPRDEMHVIREAIAAILDPYGIKWDIAGSYRRQKLASGDVDMLVQERPDLNMEGLLMLLQPLLVSKLASGPTKFMGMLRLSDAYNAHRIDIRVIEPSKYAAALMYFTGSQRFNILMRLRANEFGWELSEYGLQNNPAPITSEEDIFNLLRVRYMPPDARIDELVSLPTY